MQIIYNKQPDTANAAPHVEEFGNRIRDPSKRNRPCNSAAATRLPLVARLLAWATKNRAAGGADGADGSGNPAESDGEA